jgi:hypothetical protein
MQSKDQEVKVKVPTNDAKLVDFGRNYEASEVKDIIINFEETTERK